jgi:hypothetical protein
VTFGSEEKKEPSQTPGADREIRYENPSFRISMTKPSGWSLLLLPDHTLPKLPLDARGTLTFADTKMRYGGQVEFFTDTHFVILVVFETEGYGGISDAQQLLMDAEDEGRQALGDFKITSRPSTTQMAGESWSTAEGLTQFKTPAGETADMAIGLYCTLRDLGNSSVGYMIGVVREKDDEDKSTAEEILRSVELF